MVSHLHHKWRAEDKPALVAVTPTYCLPGKAFYWETIWGFKKLHVASSKEKVWEKTSVLLKWVVFMPGLRTTAPKRNSSIPSLYHKGLILHWRKLWRHGHAAGPSVQISDVVHQAKVTLCLPILLWDRAWEVHSSEGRAQLQILCSHKPSLPREPP